MLSFNALFHISLVCAIIWSVVAFIFPGNPVILVLAFMNTFNCIFVNWLRVKSEEKSGTQKEKGQE